jgi:hypothetical protein
VKIRARNPKDLWAGVLFVVLGVGAMVVARRYPFGGPANMGPGFFPTLLGGLLALLGAATALRGLRFTLTREEAPAFHWRPLLVVLGAIVLFGLLLQPLGLALTSALLVLASRGAAPDFRWREAGVSALALTVFTALVFVWGLRLPVPLWPAFLPV